MGDDAPPPHPAPAVLPWLPVPPDGRRSRRAARITGISLASVGVLLLVPLGVPSDPGTKPGTTLEDMAVLRQNLLTWSFLAFVCAAVAFLVLQARAERLDRRVEFRAPPGWPAAPRGWRPDEVWRPDPAWPEPPEGWRYWPKVDGV